MNISDWQYCPRCGGKLKKDSKGDGFVCPDCDAKYYSASVPGVAAIILDEKNRVLLSKRSIDPVRGKWGLPGGFLNQGEQPIKGLKREIKEELGAEIEVEKFYDFEISESLYESEKYVLAIYFFARLISDPRPGDETSKIKYFAEEEIPWEEIAGEDDKRILGKLF